MGICHSIGCHFHTLNVRIDYQFNSKWKKEEFGAKDEACLLFCEQASVSMNKIEYSTLYSIYIRGIIFDESKYFDISTTW
jgi:hypothetical protein